MEPDILQFCYKLSFLSPEQKSASAKLLLNDTSQLENFVDKLFHYEQNLLSDDFFLAVLSFAVNELRIPFILYLNCQEFCLLIENKFKRLKKEEQNSLKKIFENMFEKFLDCENAESNLDNLEQLVNLYQALYKCNLQQFYQEHKCLNSKGFQNDFERHYNSSKTKLKYANIEVQADLTKEQTAKIIEFLKNSNFEMNFETNPCEKELIKDFIEEKETLLYVLRSFLPEKESKKESPNKIIVEEPELDYIVIEDEEKIQKKIKKEESKNQPEKRLEEYTSLVFHSNVMFPEDIVTEYKNYFFPLNEQKKIILRRTICAFLNTRGGRIYIGIRDEDQCVLGLQLTTKDQDSIALVIDDLLKEITPKVEAHECVTKFIPLKSHPENQYIPGCYVVKIIVKRGKLNDIYFTNNGLTYERRFGKNQILEPYEFKKKIVERFHLPDSCQKENEDFNLRYLDPEPEKGIPKFMKIETMSKSKYNQLLEMKKKNNKQKNNIKQVPDPSFFLNKPAQPQPNVFINKVVPPQNKEVLKKPFEKSSIIFVGVPNVTREFFERQFLLELHRNLKEMLEDQIKKFIYLPEKNHIFIESKDQETAILLNEIISNLLIEKFGNSNYILDWAFMEKYQQIIKSKRYNELPI